MFDDTNIVSEVNFIETATGASSIVGQFVSATGTLPRYHRRGFSKESREITIDNGERKESLPTTLLIKTLNSSFFFFG